MADATDRPNSVLIDGEESDFYTEGHKQTSDQTDQELTLLTILNRLIKNIPLLRQASENTGQHVLLWARRGSPLRSLLVVSVGTIALLALTGFTFFLIFFVAATINAIVITLLMSLAAAGGFLALFFACVAAIYVGVLMVSVFVISSATVVAIFAVVIVTGWIGFFWTVWVASKKSIGIAKHSVYMTGSALSAYSPARNHHD
ncbi:unnamed protein product [Fraxinus pennsylvanica]|uniref:Uncharacterized protein n=1 Tax=Fraxinus pennsylvanica TaxID=56036 RepID=A0AAD2DN06_9LAMI|nr:unnamed protein product [Fraxinus pennsylvanica]